MANLDDLRARFKPGATATPVTVAALATPAPAPESVVAPAPQHEEQPAAAPHPVAQPAPSGASPHSLAGPYKRLVNAGFDPDLATTLLHIAAEKDGLTGNIGGKAVGQITLDEVCRIAAGKWVPQQPVAAGGATVTPHLVKKDTPKGKGYGKGKKGPKLTVVGTLIATGRMVSHDGTDRREVAIVTADHEINDGVTLATYTIVDWKDELTLNAKYCITGKVNYRSTGLDYNGRRTFGLSYPQKTKL